MKKAGKPIKINGVTVTPRFDWSDDFAKHYRASFRDVKSGDARWAYECWLGEQCNNDGKEVKRRIANQERLARRPNVIEAVELEKDPQHSTLAFVVYRKRPAFHYVSEKNR